MSAISLSAGTGVLPSLAGANGEPSVDTKKISVEGAIVPACLTNRLKGDKPTATGKDDTYAFYMMGVSPLSTQTHAPVDIQVVFPVGPLQIFLAGTVDFVRQDIDIPVYLKFPLLPDVRVGRFAGRLEETLNLTLETDKVENKHVLCSLSLRMVPNTSENRRYMHLSGSIDVFETKYQFNVPVFPWASVETHTILNFRRG